MDRTQMLECLNSVMAKSLYWDETIQNPELARKIFANISEEILSYDDSDDQ